MQWYFQTLLIYRSGTITDLHVRLWMENVPCDNLNHHSMTTYRIPLHSLFLVTMFSAHTQWLRSASSSKYKQMPMHCRTYICTYDTNHWKFIICQWYALTRLILLNWYLTNTAGLQMPPSFTKMRSLGYTRIQIHTHNQFLWNLPSK
jgi:hypothetical protein